MFERSNDGTPLSTYRLVSSFEKPLTTNMKSWYKTCKSSSSRGCVISALPRDTQLANKIENNTLIRRAHYDRGLSLKNSVHLQ